MNNDVFNALVDEIRSASIDTLMKKNASYASSDDRLHNFKVGAAVIGGTPAQAALGYMAKHMAALIDKVQANDFSDRDDLLEKCQDIINYTVFIWCIGNEDRPVNREAHPKDSLYSILKADYEQRMSKLGNTTMAEE